MSELCGDRLVNFEFNCIFLFDKVKGLILFLAIGRTINPRHFKVPGILVYECKPKVPRRKIHSLGQHVFFLKSQIVNHYSEIGFFDL